MIDKEYNTRKISVFKNYNAGLSELNQKPFYKKSKELNIQQIYEVVIAGGGLHDIEDIKNKLDYIRTHTKQESVYIKLSLPSFTSSANFIDERTKKAEKTYTQILGFDFDNCNTSKITELKNWDGTKLVFKSPIGNGIKLFVCTDSEEEKHQLI